MQSPASWLVDKVKDGLTDMAIDYISALPVLFGVSIGVYALLSMFSKKVASLGVFGVLGYGALIVII